MKDKKKRICSLLFFSFSFLVQTCVNEATVERTGVNITVKKRNNAVTVSSSSLMKQISLPLSVCSLCRTGLLRNTCAAAFSPDEGVKEHTPRCFLHHVTPVNTRLQKQTPAKKTRFPTFFCPVSDPEPSFTNHKTTIIKRTKTKL